MPPPLRKTLWHRFKIHLYISWLLSWMSHSLAVPAEACLVWFWSGYRDHHFTVDIERMHVFNLWSFETESHSLGRSWICGSLPASVSLVLGLQGWAATPNLCTSLWTPLHGWGQLSIMLLRIHQLRSWFLLNCPGQEDEYTIFISFLHLCLFWRGLEGGPHVAQEDITFNA